MSDPVIYRFDPRFLSPDILFPVIYADMERSWYWSNEWDASFYIALARAGFITICTDHPQAGYLLLPQIHTESASLRWKSRTMSRSLRRFLAGGVASREGLRLRISGNINGVLDSLARCWQDESWLHPPYVTLLHEVAAYPGAEFRLLGVALYADDLCVAGELGYVTGSVYTSLSGFMHPDRVRWNNMGKIQLHALASVLEDCGFRFWNLGQPQMQYKRDLGADIVDRQGFLADWYPAVAEPTPEPFFGLLDTDIDLSGRILVPASYFDKAR